MSERVCLDCGADISERYRSAKRCVPCARRKGRLNQNAANARLRQRRTEAAISAGHESYFLQDITERQVGIIREHLQSGIMPDTDGRTLEHPNVDGHQKKATQYHAHWQRATTHIRPKGIAVLTTNDGAQVCL